MATTVPTDGSIANSTNDIPLLLTKLVVSGFADNAPPAGNLFAELEVDGTHRQRCVMEWQNAGTLVSESLSDAAIPVNPSSFVDCELWYESEDKVYLDKLCECTVKITDAICQPANACEHKAGRHEWGFELRCVSSVNEYELPATVDETAEGLIDELHQVYKVLRQASAHISRLSGEQWILQEQFNIAWQFFALAYRNFREAESQSTRAALDDALKDTLVQLRLGLETFSSRAEHGGNSRRALYWSDGFDLVSQSIVQAASLLDKYTKDLNSSSSRIRSLFLDRCQQLQDDTMRYRLMFIENRSASKPLDRTVELDTLAILMGHLISSTEYDDVLLSLRGRQAGRALDILQDAILNVDAYIPAATELTAPVSEIRQRLRSLLIQVSQLSDRIPPSLFLDGVKWNSEVISRTKFSDVNSGVYKKERIVIKRVKLPIKNIATDNGEKAKKALLRALAWKTLKNDHILPLMGVAVRKPGKDSDGLHLVAPRIENSNVLNVLKKKSTTDEHMIGLVHRWMLEIAQGTAYLHGENIVHGDLRARNILVDRNYSVHIADFGLPALAEEAGVNYMAAHPALVRWLAPELLSVAPARLPSAQTLATDLFAFAGVCLELYTCDIPFAGVPDKQVSALVLKGTRPERPPTPGNEVVPMVDTLWNVLQKCWEADPTSRPTAADVVDVLDIFIHGERKPTPKASKDIVAEKSAEPLVEEPEPISSRSPSPETDTSDVSSPPATPLDTPMVDVVKGFNRAQSVDTIARVKARKGAYPEDVPPPPYQIDDPAPRVHDVANPSPEKPATPSDDSNSTGFSGEDAVVEPVVASTSDAAQPEVSELPSDVVTVVDEIKHDQEEIAQNSTPSIEDHVRDEERLVYEQVQAAEEPVTSNMTRDEHQTIADDVIRTDKIQDDDDNAPLKEETTESNPNIQEPSYISLSDSAPPDSPTEHVAESSAEETPKTADTANVAAEPAVEEVTQSAVPEDTPARAVQAAQQPAPTTEAAPVERSDEVVTQAPTTPAELSSATNPAEAEKAVASGSEAVSASSVEHSQVQAVPEPVAVVPAPEDTPHEPIVAESTLVGAVPLIVHDLLPAEDSSENNKTDAVGEHEESQHDQSEAAKILPQEDEVLPATIEEVATRSAPEPVPVAPHVEVVHEPTPGTDKTDAISHTVESQQVESHTNVDSQQNSTPETVQPPEAADASGTSGGPEPEPSVEQSAQEEVAPQETALLPTPAVPQITVEDDELPAPEGEAQPVQVTVTAAPVGTAQTHDESATEQDSSPIDSELDPHPSLPTPDDTVVRRASIRLVNPPDTGESSEEELPSVSANTGKPQDSAAKPEPEAQPAPQESQPEAQPAADADSIQQEARTQATQPAPPSNGAAVAGKPTKNSKAAKKAGKDADDVPGCCAKCVIM